MENCCPLCGAVLTSDPVGSGASQCRACAGAAKTTRIRRDLDRAPADAVVSLQALIAGGSLPPGQAPLQGVRIGWDASFKKPELAPGPADRASSCTILGVFGSFEKRCGGSPHGLGVSDDGRFVAAASDFEILLAGSAVAGCHRRMLPRRSTVDPHFSRAISPLDSTLREFEIVELASGQTHSLGPLDSGSWITKFSPDGEILALNDGLSISLLRLPSLAPFAQIALPRRADGSAQLPVGLEISGDASFVLVTVTGPARVLCLDLLGRVRWTAPWHPALAISLDLCALRDAPRVVAVRLLATGVCAARITLHDEPTAIAFAPDQRRIAIALFNGALQVWRIEGCADPVLEASYDVPRRGDTRHIVFSPNGTAIAAATRTGGLTVLSPRAWVSAAWTVGHVGQVLDIAWLPGDEEFVSLGADGQLLRWDSRTRQVLAATVVPVSGPAWGELSISPSGRGVAIVTNSVLALWDGQDLLWQVPNPSLPRARAGWSPEGEVLLWTPKECSRFDPAGGVLLGVTPLPADTLAVLGGVRPTEALLMRAGGALVLWDQKTGSITHELSGPRPGGPASPADGGAPVTATGNYGCRIAWSFPGERRVSIWDRGAPGRITHLPHEPVIALGLPAPHGRLLAVTAGDHRIVIHDPSAPAPISFELERSFSSAAAPGTVLAHSSSGRELCLSTRQGPIVQLSVPALPPPSLDRGRARATKSPAPAVARLEINLEAQGLEPLAYERLVKTMFAPRGVLLLVGPAGSGLTATAYACLARLLEHRRSVVTVEMPRRYELPGAEQLKVEPAVGQTRERVLEQLLARQFDVLLTEIVDAPSAALAFRHSGMRRLVIATMCAGDPADALTRLLAWQIPRHTLASELELIQAQRLVAKQCTECREVYRPRVCPFRDAGIDEALLSKLALPKLNRWALAFSRSPGCERCDTGIPAGFAARTALYAQMLITPLLRAELQNQATPAKLSEIARTEGMLTLRESALRKAMLGIIQIDAIPLATHS